MPLGEHGLEWVQPEAASAQVLPGGRARGALSLARADGFVARRAESRGRRVLDAVRAPFLEHFDAVRDTMLSGFPPLGGPLRLTAQSPRTTFELTRLLAGSAAGLGKRLFASDGARTWLYSAAAHGDAPRGCRGQRDRRVLFEPAGPRGRLALAARRRSALSDALASLPSFARRRDSRRRARSSGSRSRGGRVDRRRVAGGERVDAAGRDRHRDAAGAAGAGFARRLVPEGAHAVPGRPEHDQARLGARRPDPVAATRRRAESRGTRPRGRSRLPASSSSASRASPTRRARRRASTPPGRTRTRARHGARRSSASRPASATWCSPATSCGRTSSRRATRT